MADGLSSPHHRRFGVAYLALSAVLGTAIGTFVVLAERGPPPPPPPWSAWRPSTETAFQRAKEIASHVGPRYRLASGQQLVGVRVGKKNEAEKPVDGVAVFHKPHPTRGDSYDAFDGSKTLMYILCGHGPKCSNKPDEPTVERAVLRREALELALYTFRYVDGVESVVTFFPLRKAQSKTPVLFFRKDAFDKQLDHPLRGTLREPLPPIAGKLPVSDVERKRIVQLTEPVFHYEFNNDGQQRVLVLAPAAQSASRGA
jgi:hypothetical protein